MKDHKVGLVHRWQPGESGNPRGRPPGTRTTGRGLCLGVLDLLLQKTENQDKIRDALQGALDRNPLQFFRTFIFPFDRSLPPGSVDSGPPASVRIIMEMSGPQIQTLRDADFGSTSEVEAKALRAQRLVAQIERLETQVAEEKMVEGEVVEPMETETETHVPEVVK